jgi:S-adenosylmethionine:tRNA ribosyltransferase-isomerase
MKVEELDFELPPELIAQMPTENRSESRLLVLDRKTGDISDRRFSDIAEYLFPGDCLVLNDTKVLPARFFAQRTTGASIEGLYLDVSSGGLWHVMLKNSRKLKEGEVFELLSSGGSVFCKVLAERRLDDGTWHIRPHSDLPSEKLLEHIGYAPLPPYIKRSRGGEKPDYDRQRYQTVYARQIGAVAAPTAGLHFTDELLNRLSEKGVSTAHVTLHVGAGTFKPVTADNLIDHEIHSERYEIEAQNADIINRKRQAGGRIVAVGTTSVRTLETVAQNGGIRPSSGDTRLFIMPGFEYKAVDAVITNFHLPKSTLLALVGAFAGMDNIKKAYAHAVKERYRFFSYGDAMLIQ